MRLFDRPIKKAWAKDRFVIHIIFSIMASVLKSNVLSLFWFSSIDFLFCSKKGCPSNLIKFGSKKGRFYKPTVYRTGLWASYVHFDFRPKITFLRCSWAKKVHHINSQLVSDQHSYPPWEDVFLVSHYLICIAFSLVYIVVWHSMPY